MKKLFIIFLLLFALGFSPAFSQTIDMKNLSQATLVWDAVALPSGASGGTMKYQVYIMATSSDLVGTKFGSEVTTTSTLMTFTPYISYYFGVQAVYYAAGAPTSTDVSTIARSANAADCSPTGPFGILYKPGIGPIKNMLLR